MARILRLIILVAAIPLAGWLVSTYIDNTLQDRWVHVEGKVTFQEYCGTVPGSRSALCQGHRSVQLLQKASIGALGVGLGLLIFIFIAARIASANRSVLLFSFSPAMKFVLLVLSGLIIVQGAIAAYAMYVLEITLSGSIHIVLIGGVALAALMGALFMVSEGMSISKRVSKTIPGVAVSPDTQPELWRFVDRLAQRLGTPSPDNIVVGLEPSFYATSAVVIPYPSAEAQTGETLFLSLPLMRMLSIQELAAVIGHELSHFRSDEKKFTVDFYPIYAGTNQALEALQFSGSQSGGLGIALLPATAILNFFMEQFAHAEKAFGRQREFEADKLGASISSPQHMATALLKTGAFEPVWQGMWRSIVAGAVGPEELDKAYTNMSRMAADHTAGTVLREHLDRVASVAITHPTDTHPQTGVRIEAMDLSLDDMKTKALSIDLQASAATMVQNLTDIEQGLTRTEHEWRGTARRK